MSLAMILILRMTNMLQQTQSPLGAPTIEKYVPRYRELIERHFPLNLESCLESCLKEFDRISRILFHLMNYLLDSTPCLSNW